YSNDVILISVLIAQEARAAAVVHDDEIEIAVIVVIEIRRASTHNRVLQRGTQLVGNIFKLVIAFVVKDLLRLGVFDSGLQLTDVVGNVPVYGKDVGAAIQIVIKEQNPKSQRLQ